MAIPTKLTLEIVTPERALVTEQVDEVQLPGAEGYFGVLPGHTPLLATLQVGELWYRIGSERHYVAIAFGFVEVLPDDRQTDTTRWLYSWRHNQQFTPWLAGYLNLNKVSDDKYFADLSERVAITSQSTLAREAGLVSSFGPLTVLARVEKFQTLQDENAPIVPPYNRLPQVLATLGVVERGGDEVDWRPTSWR